MQRSSSEKVVRACIVQAGRVIEERILPRRAVLSVGTGANNTFVVSDPSMPKSHNLLAVRGGRYELILTEVMGGKISIEHDPAPVDLVTLKSQHLLKRRGHAFVLPLHDGHRGTVVVGDVTVIFQFVVPPPPPPLAVLPPGIRMGFVRRVDWKLAISFFVVLAIETPIIWKVAAHPLNNREMTLENLDARWAQLIVPERQVVEVKAAAETGKAKAVAQPKPSKKSSDSANHDAAARAKAKAARITEIRKSIAGKGVLAVLGAEGDGPASAAVANVLSQGGIAGDLDQAFEGISGVGLATSNERSTRGSGTGKAASIGGLATAGGGAVGTGVKREEKVGSVKAEAPEVDGALDSDAVARVVRSRMRMVEDCYQRELKRNPRLAGKIEIEFTIGADGAVMQTRVASNKMGTDEVAACVVSRIQRWRFPKPAGGSVTVTFPFIFTPSE